MLVGGLAGMGSLLVVGLIVGFVVLKRGGADESEDERLKMQNLNDGSEASEPF